MANYKLTHIDLQAPRTEFHDLLNLTGMELSFNNLPAGGAVPFVHKHKENEELYLVLAGSGTLFIDGEELPIKAGDAFRIDPAGCRSLQAGPEGLTQICIQAKAGSLESFTMGDGQLVSDGPQPEWVKKG